MRQPFLRVFSVVRAPSFGPGRLVLLSAFLAFFIVLVRNAWVSDDAYIMFRTVDNFLHGYGLRWNVAERVQSYTHPLWMFLVLVLSWLTGETHYTSMILSIAITLLAAGLLVSLARRPLVGVFVLSILLFSKAFVDFSVSGLEDPLTHLLLALFMYVYVREGRHSSVFFRLSFLASLAAVNRLDSILMYIPMLAYILFQRFHWKQVVYGVVGFLPLILWEGFSLIYYGFPFPNTAYAKLGTGLPRIEFIRQGLYYLVESIVHDPITLGVIVAALILPFFFRKFVLLPVMLGVLLSLAYTVWVGGDFMSGRFLTAPFFLSVFIIVLLVRAELSSRVIVSLIILICAVGVGADHNPLLSGSDYGKDNASHGTWRGIADERAHYFQSGGLLRMLPNGPIPDHLLAEVGQSYRRNGSSVVVNGVVGQAGYFAGPRVHIIDTFALNDPLLARLPAESNHGASPDGPWRIGHFARNLPEGYLSTISEGENVIADADLAAYYDALSTIVRGPLFTRERFSTIWKMNTGQYDYLITNYLSRL